MNWLVVTYLSYVALSLGTTIWVARTLHKNGRIWLVDVFSGNVALADSVNTLLVVGFYLINLGYVALALEYGGGVDAASGAIEVVAGKMGRVLLVLGGMHFLNLYIFSRIRRKAALSDAPAPVDPDEYLPPTAAAGAADAR
jgi:hypothetical protein